MTRIISVVSNDIFTDNRIHKIAVSLSENGYEVVIAGRMLKNSQPITDRPYKTRRFKLLFNKGPLFYANLNIRLAIFLLKCKCDVILSNDLDTLPACSIIARIRKKKLIYDSHELFPELPELVNRPLIRKIWLCIEKTFIPGIDSRFTVCDSIAKFYEDKYHVHFETIRNLSYFRSAGELAGITGNSDTRVIIYQGALNLGRGLELAIHSMVYIDSAILWIIGDGNCRENLIQLAARLGLNEKVKFLGRIPADVLWRYTAKADVGISLEEDLGLNYRYSLPNKLFDYIQARIPVIISDLPEMSAIVRNYRVGRILAERNPQKLAELINSVLTTVTVDSEFRKNIEHAANELCWEKEEEKLISIFRHVQA